MKKLRYILEAIGFYILFFFFRLMPPALASDTGGWLGRRIGPGLAASRKALRNLRRALPDLDEAAQKRVIAGMWENLGRVVAEYPHLRTISRDHTEIRNMALLNDGQKNAVFFSAHFSNWEVNVPAVFLQYGYRVDMSYRAPNNPWIDRLLMKTRSMGGQIPAHSKSREGGRGMMQALKDGRSLGILIDQKYNQGVCVPFFGIPAMTNPFFVQLAQKYHLPLFPIRNTRLGGPSFRLDIFEPIPVFEPDGSPRPVEDVIAEAHALLEEWIREKPEEWLWLHKRWPEDNKESEEP